MTKKLSIVFLFLLSACDGGSGEKAPNPLHLPPQGFMGDSIKGAALYDQNCLACHGKRGVGTNQGPALVHDIYNSRHHAELAFHLAVNNGVRAHHWNFGDMEPIPHLSPEDVEHIVRYVREIQRESGIQ
ncbi:MAG: cytochrome c [Proteobacteria bacterium]|nr:cytochrome c [Pseudomonadota bacterium]